MTGKRPIALWEYLLRADRTHDLTSEGGSLQWVESHGHTVGIRMENVPMAALWGGEPRRRFAAIIFGLRSLAARLKDFRSQSPRMDAREADDMFRRFLGRLRAQVVTKASRGRGDAPLNADRFGGLEWVVPRPDDA